MFGLAQDLGVSPPKSFGNHVCGDHRTVRTRLLYKSVLVFTTIHICPLSGELRALADSVLPSMYTMWPFGAI